MSAPLFHGGYPPSHPWYYVLGGVPRTPKEIAAYVQKTRGRGYLVSEITTSDARCEPRRSQELRALRAKALGRLRTDLDGYRRAVRDLRAHRAECDARECHDVHTAISLKHAHVSNEMAHLMWIDELLSMQPDLFEC